jgi:tyrosyl-tRNA synthetase
MNIDEQVEYLMQGVDYGDPAVEQAMAVELRERLLEAEREGRPLRVYCGYDPTSTDLHLGHTVTMRKLRQFQELGHDVTFLIGIFTSLIGDPSDKDKLRPQLDIEKVMHNAETYAEQPFGCWTPRRPCALQFRLALQADNGRFLSAGFELYCPAVPHAR